MDRSSQLRVDTELSSPSKVRLSAWLNAGWDVFMEDPGSFLIIGLVAVALLAFTHGLLWGPVMLGLAAVGVRRVRMGRVEVADFFQGFRYFLPAVLAGLLVLVFSVIGLAFLIVPGVVVFSMYLFTFHFIFDQEQDFWEGMESSRKLVARDYFGFALFALILLGINFLGLAFLLIGTILTVPVTALAMTAAYLDIIEGPPAPSPDSKPVMIE